MKKTIIFSLVCCTLFITGCGCGKKIKTTECNLTRDDYKVKFIFKYNDKDKKILSFERIETIDNYDASLKSNYQSFFTSMKNWDDSIDNYDYEYEITETTITSKLNINFEKVDYDELLNVPGLYPKYYDYDKKYFDIDLAIKEYKNDSDYEGLVCN